MALLGMRGSGVFTDDERPRNWRQAIMLMFPNGDTPLTAILSMLAEEPTDDPEFRWFEKGLPVQRGLIVGAATNPAAKPADDADIAAADATAEIALTVKPDGGAEDDLTWLKVGHVLYNQTTEENYLVIKKNADWIVVRRDIGNKFASNPAVTGNGTTGDPIVIVGSGYPEGADVGEQIAYQPIRHFNYTQIFRTALSITRTGRRTRLRYDRTGPYMEAKREALQLHGIEQERAFLFGEREEVTALTNGSEALSVTSTGRPLRTTRGILNWLPAITTASVSLHTDIGTLNAGALTEVHLDAFLEEAFRHGSSEKLAFIGSTALNVFNQMAKNKFTLQAVPSDQTYGMALVRVISPFGTMLLKQHPLMSTDPVWRKDLFLVDPALLKYRYIDDTTFLRNRQGNGVDAATDEYLTEAGLEAHFSGAVPSTAGGLPGVAGPGAHGRLKGIATYGG